MSLHGYLCEHLFLSQRNEDVIGLIQLACKPYVTSRLISCDVYRKPLSKKKTNETSTHLHIQCTNDIQHPLIVSFGICGIMANYCALSEFSLIFLQE